MKNDHAKLVTFLHVVRRNARNIPNHIWGDQLRYSLSNDLVKVGWGGVLELTDSGRAALTEETGGDRPGSEG